MIKSMTGFGKGETKSKSGVFTVEIRTVNHRYFDLSSKIPNSLVLLEDRIKELLNKDIKRGKVNLFLSHRASEKDSGLITFDKQAIDKYYKILAEVKKRLDIKEEIKLSHILSFTDVIIHEERGFDIDAMWVFIKEAAVKAVSDCNKMREREGKALYKDFSARITRISNYIDTVSGMAPSVVAEYKSRLDARIKDIVKNKAIDQTRLETELALFAKQCDISEELTRIKSHLEGFRKALEAGKEAGRKLDFILQELNREINTLGAKANDIKITRIVINIKSELEKMREQAQNVE
ncbi:MAG: YicC family protein [Candidatus Omnitrophica bacterium CG1_02_40_15]|nr:MAG: YicC family protein [Candidatus Omnitrophica bacterium CG1_02_40_15]